ncbi:hypothetical protein K466DRAFT_609760, partial [Polyporus arcularius HHB13444]
QQQQSRTSPTSTDPAVGPAQIDDPELQKLVNVALPIIIRISSAPPGPIPLHVAEAIHMRAMCASTGIYPQFIPHDPRTAFRDFERAAKSGYHAAWFKLGREYENFECFERGTRHGVESCACVAAGRGRGGRGGWGAMRSRDGTPPDASQEGIALGQGTRDFTDDGGDSTAISTRAASWRSREGNPGESDSDIWERGYLFWLYSQRKTASHAPRANNLYTTSIPKNREYKSDGEPPQYLRLTTRPRTFRASGA